MRTKELAAAAEKSKKKAYAPYSKFRVGAALLAKSGKIYEGANIENASFSMTMCAERTAAFSAVLNNERKFEAIAIASDLDGYIAPCGACRQVLLELCGKNLLVIMLNGKNKVKKMKLGELLPYSFNNF